MANRPGRSLGNSSHECSPFHRTAANVRIPATTPNTIVSKPEKGRTPVETETNNTTNKTDNPTAHHPSCEPGDLENLPQEASSHTSCLREGYLSNLPFHHSTRS